MYFQSSVHPNKIFIQNHNWLWFQTHYCTMKRLRQYWWQRENKKSLRSLTVSCHLRRQKFCLRKPTEAPFPYYHFSVWQKIFERKHTNYMNSIKIKFLKTKLSSSSVELHSQHRRIMLSHSWIWNIQSTECQTSWTIKDWEKESSIFEM